MDNVGKRIRKLRKDRGLSQKALAEAVGIKQPSLADIESGESKGPAALTLIRMAKLFEVDAEHLLTGKGPKHPAGALTHEESELLLMFRSLSPAGQAYLLERARSMHADECRLRPEPPEDDSTKLDAGPHPKPLAN